MLNCGHILDNKYEVLKTLGQGGMSTVYLCKNVRLGNLWAIKEIKKKLEGYMDFSAEPNILKNLSHPGIPRIVDIFHEEDNLYIVEDYIEGQTLQDYVKNNGELKLEEIRSIGISVCEIIEYLHSFNPPIIYRDLKPSNIMITPSGKIVLIDFGISRIYKKDSNKDTIYMGSRGYAAPEQYGSEQTCKQTDIYGLGAVIYFMAAGKAPAVLLEPLKDENYNSEVALALKKIIQRAMQIDIIDRYPSVELMKKELINLLDKQDEYTRTLLMNAGEHCDKTLLMNNNVSKDEDNLQEFRTRATNKSELRGLMGVPNKKNNINKEGTSTTVTEDRGKINFYKIKEKDDRKIDEEKSNKKNNLKVSKVIPKKNKKNLKISFILMLILAATIFALGYFVTDQGRKDSTIEQQKSTTEQSTDNSVSNEQKPENTSSNEQNNVSEPLMEETVDTNVNQNNWPIKDTTTENIDNSTLESLKSYYEDKDDDKNDNKGKSNGKAKGKIKNDKNKDKDKNKEDDD